MSNISTPTLIGFFVLLAIVGGIAVALSQNGAEQPISAAVTSFEECVAAGNLVMPARRSLGAGGESYPRQCRSADGQLFVEEIISNDPGQGLGLQANGCAVAGCSGQLCVSADEAGDIVTTCEYRAEYVCYEEASCEPQADGKCGWTQTEEMSQCLANPPASDENLQQI